VKVLHVTPVFYPAFDDGGPIVAFYELCRGLARQGSDIRVLTTDAHGSGKSLNVETGREIKVETNFRIRYCKRAMRRSMSPTLLRLLVDYVKEADVVHLQSVYNFPTIPTLLLCKIFGKPVVWSPDGALQWWKGSRRTRIKAVWNRICRIVAPSNLIIHATSQQEAQESQDILPFAQTMVVAHAIPIPTQVRRIKTHGVLQLLYLGRLDPKKGIENLLAACKIIEQETELSWSLTIAGDGNENYARALRTMVRNLGFALARSEQVLMIGQVLGETKEQVFERADVLVVPSYTENFGVVIAEALAREIPVIASTGTPWERLEEINCGLWVNNDPRSLAQSIQRISRMPLTEMGQRGRAWVQSNFSGDRVGKEMLACYEEVYNRMSRKPVTQGAPA
jgi:glycosyltransferase involved in cell wall biosynthesis